MNKISVELNQIGKSASEASIRNHRVIIDRPEEKGGSNQGPMGGEILLVSLGGCFNSNLLAAIDARSVAISNVHLSITGTMGGEPTIFEKIEVKVSADHQDQNLLKKLVTIAERACISSNTLKSAGVEVIFLVG